MPVALSDFTATPATTADGDDVVVVVGGCDDHQVSCDWWDGCSYCPSVAAAARAFDVAADAWVDLAAPPRPRYRHAAAYDAEANLVYVVGGRDVDDGLVEAVDVYDVAADAWTTLPGVAVARSDLGAVVHGGALLVAGGYDLNYTAYETTLRVDVASGAVTEGPPLLEARGDFGFALLGDTAYAVGGWSHEDWCAPLASVEALDLAADGAAFGAAAPLAVARGDKALASTGEALYVVGGEHNNGCATGSAPVDDVEALGDGAGEWSVEADIPEERFRTAAAAVGDYLYVFGGQAAESTSCAAPRPFFKTFAVRAMMLRFLISSSTEGFVRRVDRHSLPLSRPRAPRDRRPPRRAPRDDAPRRRGLRVLLPRHGPRLAPVDPLARRQRRRRRRRRRLHGLRRLRGRRRRRRGPAPRRRRRRALQGLRHAGAVVRGRAPDQGRGRAAGRRGRVGRPVRRTRRPSCEARAEPARFEPRGGAGSKRRRDL